ncbi:hypothetical protein ACJJWD_08880 [Comamonas testosteroni]|uniref:hypothetical protein n=1 Tax=Comamonas testosteroni TaxID=285 RepID=UPI00389ADB10
MDIDTSGYVAEDLFFGSYRRHLNEEYLAINLMEIDLGGTEEQQLKNTNTQGWCCVNLVTLGKTV